jgi:hypothetical protein
MPEPVPHNEEILHEVESLAHQKQTRFHSSLLVLAAIGTILGGVLAAFEIYTHVFKHESDTHHLELQGNARLEVPKGWEIIDSDAVQVMARGMDPRFDSLLNSGDAKCLQFIGPIKDSSDEAGIVCVVMGKTFPNLDYNTLESDLQQIQGCSLCKQIELESGRCIHCVCLRESVFPDGSPMPITQDCYVFIKGGDLWMLMFITEDHVYMRESGTFAKIAASFEAG